MISSRASNLLAFPGGPSGKRPLSAAKTLEHIRPTHAEVTQQLRNHLQTSLELPELLQMFFDISQQLISYSGLSFHNPSQQLNVNHGRCIGAFQVDYRLEVQNEFLGTLSIHHVDELSEHELVSLESLTAALVFPLRNALKYHAVLYTSMHDPLTGVRNRAGMYELLERDLQSASRTGNPLSILMIDVDHFKTINDEYGHAGGDAALIAVAQQLQEQLRSMDAIFRFGGEEFLVVLPNTNTPYVLYIAERLRKAIEN